jgi:hypothetical protein
MKCTQYLKIEEDIENPKVLSAKKKPEITSTISSSLKPGQGVLQCDLQSLHYKLVDMHKITPNIQEVMEFPNWLSVKQNLQKL